MATTVYSVRVVVPSGAPQGTNGIAIPRPLLIKRIKFSRLSTAAAMDLQHVTLKILRTSDNSVLLATTFVDALSVADELNLYVDDAEGITAYIDVSVLPTADTAYDISMIGEVA